MTDPVTPLSDAPAGAAPTLVGGAVASVAVTVPTAGESLYPQEVALVNPTIPPEGAAGPRVDSVDEAVTPPVVDPAALVEPPKDSEVAPPAPLTVADYPLTVPTTMTLDPDLMAQYKALAVESNITPEAAQKTLDLLPAILEKQVAAINVANQQTFTNTLTKWESEVRAMPEFTGEENSTRSLAAIARMIDDFGTPEVREALNLTGAGNNPAVVKFFLSLATSLGEGKPTPPGRMANPNRHKTPGQTLYPNQPN